MQNRKLVFKNSFSFQNQPKALSLHAYAQLLCVSEQAGVRVYDCSTKRDVVQLHLKADAYDAKVYSKYEPVIAQFVWPYGLYRTLVVSNMLNQLDISYLQYNPNGTQYGNFALTSL